MMWRWLFYSMWLSLSYLICALCRSLSLFYSMWRAGSFIQCGSLSLLFNLRSLSLSLSLLFNVARWLFYSMWLSLSYLICALCRSLSLSYLMWRALSFICWGAWPFWFLVCRRWALASLRNCKMSKCNCRGFDPSCRYRPPYLRTSVY